MWPLLRGIAYALVFLWSLSQKICACVGRERFETSRASFFANDGSTPVCLRRSAVPTGPGTAVAAVLLQVRAARR